MKSKLQFNKNSRRQTGGGPFIEKKLNEFEESVAMSCGLEAHVKGVNTSFGIPTPDTNETVYPGNDAGVEDVHIDIDDMYHENEENMNTINSIQAPRKKPTRKQTKEDLFCIYVEEIKENTKIQRKILDVLTADYDLKQKIYDLKKKNYELREKRLKLGEIKYKLKKNYIQNKSEWKEEELDLKRVKINSL